MSVEPEFKRLKAERDALIESVVSLSTTDAWVRVRRILLESPPFILDKPVPTIYEGPTRAHLLPLQYEALAAFIDRHGVRALDLLYQYCDDPCPLLAAYCIFGLFHADDPRLGQAVQRVSGRSEKIATSYGCFIWDGTLSQYAEEKMKEVNEY